LRGAPLNPILPERTLSVLVTGNEQYFVTRNREFPGRKVKPHERGQLYLVKAWKFPAGLIPRTLSEKSRRGLATREGSGYKTSSLPEYIQRQTCLNQEAQRACS